VFLLSIYVTSVTWSDNNGEEMARLYYSPHITIFWNDDTEKISVVAEGQVRDVEKGDEGYDLLLRVLEFVCDEWGCFR